MNNEARKIPACYEKHEFLMGIRACKSGHEFNTENMSDSFIAGYSYQYEKEQIETQKGYGNYDS